MGVRKYFITYLVIFLPAIIVNAQFCEWLRTGGGINSVELIRDVTTDNNSNVIAVGFYKDSFSISGRHFPQPPSLSSSTFLIKLNPYGSVVWAKGVLITGGFGWCEFVNVVTDKNRNIYVTGEISGSADFGNGVIISGTSSRFLVKYNKNGKAQWVRKVSSTSSAGLGSLKVHVDSDDNIIWGFLFGGTANIAGTSSTLISQGGADLGFLKYDANGNLIRATSFGSNAEDILGDIGTDGENNIYIVGDADTTFTFGSSVLLGDGEIILKTDSTFSPLSARKTNLKTDGLKSNYWVMAVQSNGKFALASIFAGTVNFGGITLSSTSPPNSSILGKTCRVIYYDANLKPIWAKMSVPVSTNNSNSIILPLGKMSIKKSNIYFGGEFASNSFRFGSTTINDPGGTRAKFFLTKIDTLGNFLWSFSSDYYGRSSFGGVTVDEEGNPIMGGGFTHKIRVFDRYDSIGTNTGIDLFVAKISDYTITRGYVSSGPYCAGDTIDVPFTKKGRFNIGNEFIAELSDSAGNFEGGHRELGRLKDTAAGIINGSLPLFNVATTNKYRIRIISTDPIVQSFYKLDTLRLLIYSKDSANAGPDQFVCKGQQITLGTTGGSKWLWTPADSLETPQDSGNRSPTTQPLYNSTEFRIIISDSSGCGDIDTDYVKIYVRPSIETKIQGDSQICRGLRQTLQAQVTGGDSSQYWYQWKVKGLNLIQSTKSTYFIRPANTTEYELIVGDSCTDKIDTAFFKVTVLNNLKANPSADTTICKGKTAQLSAIGTGCNPDKYTYEWIVRGSSTVLSNNDSITVTPTTTTQYQVILKDTSTLLVDTATITVTVDSVFSISTTKDSTICQGQSIDLTANVFSCDTSNMIYSWRANNNQLSTNNSITVSPTTTTTYTVIGENTFNGLKDTAQVTITVRAPLNLTINQDSTICIGEQAELRATATGGNTNTYQIEWKANNQQLSTNNKLKVAPTATTTYKAVLSDGCTINNDSAELTITVRPKLDVTVNTDTTICIGETAVLRAIPAGGLATAHQIQWVANNQQLSTNNIVIVNPTATTTYKAILSDGCTTPNDSSTITVTVRPKLTLTLNTDTTICVGEEAELRATAKGGLESNHQIQWTANNQQLSTNNILKVQPTATTTYKAILSDNCTTPNDSSEITITVRPPLQLTTAAKDSICSNETLLLTATPSGGLVNNHQIQWTTDNGLWTSNQNPATDTPQVTTKYIATLTDNCSPPVQDSLQVIVLPVPIADFTATPIAGCPPLKVTLTDNSTANDSTQNTWTIGSGEYQETKTQTHELLKTGVYNIKLNVKNQLGCSDEMTQQNAITVFEKPQANFIITPNIKEVEEPLQLYNLSRGATNSIWQMGDGNQLNTPKDTTYKYHEDDTGNREVQLIAINNQGCRDTSKQNILLYNKVHCTIPTAFTPNGDGLNNTFKPVCVGAATYTLTIYNRWGQVIYQQQNGAWDGNYIEQPVPMGVYMYKIQINAQSQKKKLTYGTVQLIR